MAKLGTVLVREGVITPRQLEEALRMQVLYGGRLGTNLVELKFVEPQRIDEWLGRTTGFPVAIDAMCAAAPQEVLDLVPGPLAAKHECFPLHREHRRLHLAMVNPADLAATDEIAFTTGLRLVTYVIAELRLYRWLEKRYGIRREHRFIQVSPHDSGMTSAVDPSERPTIAVTSAVDLSERRTIPVTSVDEIFRGARPPSPPVAPPARPTSTPPPASRPPSLLSGSRLATAPPHIPPTMAPSPGPPAARPTPPPLAPFGVSTGLPNPLSTRNRASTAPPLLRPPTPTLPPATRRTIATLPPALRPPSAPPPAAGIPRTDSPTLVRPSAPVPTPAASSASVVTPAQWKVSEPPPTLSLAEAFHGLDEVHTREEVGEIVLRFGLSLLDTTLLFTVRDRSIFGWVGRGGGTDTTIVERLSLTLDAPSMFRDACDRVQVVSGPVSNLPLHRHLFQALRRSPPQSAIVVPVVMRGRVVNLIYGDRVAGPDVGSTAAGLVKLANAVALAYERIVRESKRKL